MQLEYIDAATGLLITRELHCLLSVWHCNEGRKKNHATGEQMLP